MLKYGVYFDEGLKKGVFLDEDGTPVLSSLEAADSWARKKAEEYVAGHPVIFGVAEIGGNGDIIKVKKIYQNISGKITEI